LLFFMLRLTRKLIVKRSKMLPIIHYPTPAIISFKHQNVVKENLRMLESHKIWSDFEEISKIYRESGHNEDISAYLATELDKSGFEIDKKSDGTICAYRGLNQSRDNAIILQAHMDMVGISADGNSRKPIKLIEKDGWLSANERTLGADDGIGVAAILAVAQDEKFKNIPLEMIITTDEETSMKGAKKLVASDFRGKYLINLDSEEFGHVIKGCAGISEFHIDEKIKMEQASGGFDLMQIKLAGANGGHSACVDDKTLNPIKYLLSELKNNEKDVRIVEMSGGERINAVPRDSEVKLLVAKNKTEEVKALFEKDLKKLSDEKVATNPDFNYSISVDSAPEGIKYVDSEFQSSLLKYMNELPIGLFTKFENGCNKTSQNLGIIKISDGDFHAEIMGRSSDLKEGEDLRAKTIDILSKMFGKEIKVTNISPIWEPKEKGKLEDVVVKAFEATNGKTPILQVEHGGLEAAVFAQVKPEMENVSIGPTLETPHSIRERLEISTVVPFYDWLSEILQLLGK